MTIDHIAIVVEDMDQYRHAMRSIGFPAGPVRRYDEVGMDIAFIGEGESRLELLCPFSDQSPIADHPGGLHHVAFKVADIEAAWKRMEESSLFSVEGPPRQGAHSRIFFFRITGNEQTLYECVEG